MTRNTIFRKCSTTRASYTHLGFGWTDSLVSLQEMVVLVNISDEIMRGIVVLQLFLFTLPFLLSDVLVFTYTFNLSLPFFLLSYILFLIISCICCLVILASIDFMFGVYFSLCLCICHDYLPHFS